MDGFVLPSTVSAAALMNCRAACCIRRAVVRIALVNVSMSLMRTALETQFLRSSVMVLTASITWFKSRVTCCKASSLWSKCRPCSWDKDIRSSRVRWFLMLVATDVAKVEAMRAVAPMAKKAAAPRVVRLLVWVIGFEIAASVSCVSFSRALSSVLDSRHAVCASELLGGCWSSVPKVWQMTGSGWSVSLPFLMTAWGQGKMDVPDSARRYVQ